MSKRRPYIFMTQDKLIDLCRYDIGWIDIVGGTELDAYPDTGFDVQCENEYPMLLSDLKTALCHFEDEKLSFDDFAFDWWCPITTYFYEDLCLDELLGPDPDNIADLPLPPLPETDEDMIVTILLKIAKIADNFDENGGFPRGQASEVLGLPNLINMIENYEENKDLPPEERTYTRDQMLTFLNHWDNSLLLADAREDVINHFVDFTNILCKQHVFEALKIKAFAVNGGNAAFPCDYGEAVKLLTILLKEFGFGYAANALGFIYYDGKYTGIPDYDKAFAYFAIASNYGISEAKLKFADMLLMGDAGNPDPILAYNTYLQVYHDARIRFESGDYNSNLPESAIRIARALKLFPDQKVKRLKLLLEATYSSFVRYQNNKVYTDLEFSKSVQAEIDKVINEFTKDDPVKINTGWQQLGLDDVNDVFDDFSGPPFPAYYTVGVRKLKSNRYKLTIKRHSLFPDAYPPLSLSVQPWLLRAGLCDNLVFTVPAECGNDALDYLANSGEEGTFDKLVVRSTEEKNASRFSFVRNGEVVLGFEAGRIFFNKPSGKTLG
ncbi:MAG: sel1 repeat family protein [Clostridiales bacterium]|nr:sel1 repeat family protein [Clostridiales bacterium]